MDKLTAQAVWEVLWDTLLIEYIYRDLKASRSWYSHREYDTIRVRQPILSAKSKPADIALVLEVIPIPEQDVIVLCRKQLLDQWLSTNGSKPAILYNPFLHCKDP